MAMLIGETMLIISEYGQTEHTTSDFKAALHAHVNMKRIHTLGIGSYTYPPIEVKAAYVYHRSTQKAYWFENITVGEGRNSAMRWEHTHSEDYAEISKWHWSDDTKAWVKA